LSAEALPIPRLTQFAALVERQLGLSFPTRRIDEFRRYLDTMRRNEGIEDLDGFIAEVVRTDGAIVDWKRVAVYLTVGETYFFRERGAMSALTNDLLPELITQGRARGRKLRIWSAGCGTGEEAYTIAILLRRLVPDIDQWELELLATDLNRRSLESAEAARYRLWSFRDTPDWVRAAYFEQLSDGRFELADDVRKLVRFEHHNLASPDWPIDRLGQMDLILCRNVLIYFAPERIRVVTHRLSQCLAPRGYLITSPSELNSEHFPDFELESFDPGFAYQHKRREDAASEPREARRSNRYRRMREEASGVSAAELEVDRPPPPAPGEPEGPLGREFPLLPDRARREEPQSALEKCAAALRERPMDATAHYVHAAVLEELGNMDDAEDALRRTLYLDPNFIVAHFMRGHVLARLGRSKAAFRHFAAAARLTARCEPDQEVPFADGLNARRLADVIAIAATRLRENP